MHINGQPETVVELKEKEDMGDIPLTMRGLGMNHPYFQRDPPRVRRCLICLRGKYGVGIHWICGICFEHEYMKLKLCMPDLSDYEAKTMTERRLIRDCI